LRRSITWDQGKEMAEHARFSVETGVPVYFCDPRSPWHRLARARGVGRRPRSFDLQGDKHPLKPSNVAPLGRSLGGQLAAVHRVEHTTQHLGSVALVGLPHARSLTDSWSQRVTPSSGTVVRW